MRQRIRGCGRVGMWWGETEDPGVQSGNVVGVEVEDPGVRQR